MTCIFRTLREQTDHMQINRDNLEAKDASKEVHDGENRKE
jgi:hypothetical protein